MKQHEPKFKQQQSVNNRVYVTKMSRKRTMLLDRIG